MKDNSKVNDILLPILDVLDTAMEVSIEILSLLYEGNQINTLITDLNDVIEIVEKTQQPVSSFLVHGSILEIGDNLKETLTLLSNSMDIQDFDQAKHLVEFQLLPLFRLWKEAFYFWGFVYPEKEKMDEYYENEFALHYSNPYCSDEENYEYKISVVVPAYNHLETTQKCIKNLLEYTDFKRLNAELILIDHGSSDGTFEFFQSIPEAKVIRLKNNVKMYMFALMSMVCRGKYMVLVSNDILVTKNWAENLVACMDSDKKIAMAVPMTPNICNLQMLRVPTNNPEQFVTWANSFNQSRPNLWSDRARLMPPVCMYRTRIVSELGLADPYLYAMEFWDDDFSFRVRRAGYRQVLCEDTACYHFGSVTSKEAQKKENTLQNGRELFIRKTGVDAWGNGFCYDYTAVQLFKQNIVSNKEVDILAIDCGFGDTPLQMKNELRRLGHSCSVYNLTVQQEYASDLQPLSDKFMLTDTSICNALMTEFVDEKFDVIYFGCDFADYPDYERLLSVVKNRLNEKGILLFSTRNPYYVFYLNQMLQMGLSEKKISFLQPKALNKTLNNIFSKTDVIPIKQEINGINTFMNQHYSVNNNMKKLIEENLLISSTYYICRR